MVMRPWRALIVDRADRTAHDEARRQIEHRRQIVLGTLPDRELGRVADPALIRRRRREVAVQHVGGERIGVRISGSLPVRAGP